MTEHPTPHTHKGKFQCGNVMLILEEGEWETGLQNAEVFSLLDLLAIPSYNKLRSWAYIVLVSSHLGESIQGPRPSTVQGKMSELQGEVKGRLCRSSTVWPAWAAG